MLACRDLMSGAAAAFIAADPADRMWRAAIRRLDKDGEIDQSPPNWPVSIARRGGLDPEVLFQVTPEIDRVLMKKGLLF